MRKQRSRKFYLRWFSLFFSLFIWLYVVSSAEVEVDKAIKLTIETPLGLALKNEIAAEVIFRLKGPRVFVRKFTEAKQEIKVKIEDYYTKGRKEYQIKLSRYYPKTPLGVEVLSKNVRSINLKLEKKISKRVPISLSIPEGVKEKVRLLKPVLSDSFVLVEGAKSIVRKVRKVKTELLDLSEISGKNGNELNLEVIDPRIHLSFSKVEVRYKGLADFEEFTYANIPIIFHSEKFIKSASARSVDIRVYGSKSTLRSSVRRKIQAVALVNEETIKGDIAIEMKLPEGLELKSVSPKSVKVQVE